MSKKKILVLEKDEDILQVLSHILMDEGYDVKLARSEKGLLQQIKLYCPDVILLDIIRPTPEGTELCRAIKAAEGISHIPVIALSTHTKADTLKDVCADDVIKKPFDVDFLVDIIEKQVMA
ncbi:MAG: hypothetical protein K0S09_2167 [Sphingobacteriaceae bacterium]|jgi:CheY-like chemotaxis protein|nr:hypothetical protein [Sphingobacteriaceae bacterium]